MTGPGRRPCVRFSDSFAPKRNDGSRPGPAASINTDKRLSWVNFCGSASRHRSRRCSFARAHLSTTLSSSSRSRRSLSLGSVQNTGEVIDERPGAGRALRHVHTETLEVGMVWLRYRVDKAPSTDRSRGESLLCAGFGESRAVRPRSDADRCERRADRPPRQGGHRLNVSTAGRVKRLEPPRWRTFRILPGQMDELIYLIFSVDRVNSSTLSIKLSRYFAAGSRSCAATDRAIPAWRRVVSPRLALSP